MDNTNNKLQKIFDKSWADNKPARDYYQKLEDLSVSSISKDGFVTVIFNGMLDLIDLQTTLGFTNKSIKDAVNLGLLRTINETYRLRDELKFEPEEFLLDIANHKEK